MRFIGQSCRTLRRLSVFPVSVVRIRSVDSLPDLAVVDEQLWVVAVSSVVCLRLFEVVSDCVLSIVVDFLIRIDVIVHSSLNLQVRYPLFVESNILVIIEREVLKLTFCYIFELVDPDVWSVIHRFSRLAA